MLKILNFEILKMKTTLELNIWLYTKLQLQLQSDIWFKRYEQFFELQNNVKQEYVICFSL